MVGEWASLFPRRKLGSRHMYRQGSFHSLHDKGNVKSPVLAHTACMLDRNQAILEVEDVEHLRMKLRVLDVGRKQGEYIPPKPVRYKCGGMQIATQPP